MVRLQAMVRQRPMWRLLRATRLTRTLMAIRLRTRMSMRTLGLTSTATRIITVAGDKRGLMIRGGPERGRPVLFGGIVP
jgi:hypothetical protein